MHPKSCDLPSCVHSIVPLRDTLIIKFVPQSGTESYIDASFMRARERKSTRNMLSDTCWIHDRPTTSQTLGAPLHPNADTIFKDLTMLAGLPMYIPTSPQFYMLLFSRTCGRAYEPARMMRCSHGMRLVNLLGYTPSISYYPVYKI
jgi:hypothetical protein